MDNIDRWKYNCLRIHDQRDLTRRENKLYLIYFEKEEKKEKKNINNIVIIIILNKPQNT